jgi:dihydrofolate reductase
MRKLVVIEFVSLDGVMQGLRSPDKDRDGGFEHGGWAADSSRAVEGLKSQGDGNIAVLGSGELVAELRTRDLVDDYRLFLHPLLLGTGSACFGSGRRHSRCP